ncbi:hypothetical protein BGZ46_003197 [Entomortierella lignicola]|nr:hypothetical protein BGZ46_003197 [Entomortierella lignicola]
MYTNEKSHILLATLAILAFSSSAVNAGCTTDIGYRVQYSDMAALKSVHLQVLGADGSIVVDNVDQATHEQWSETRTRSLSWQVPADLAPGEYKLHATGYATYPCRDGDGNHQRRCDFVMNDEKPLVVQSLPEGQQCPAAIAPTTTPAAGANATNSDQQISSQDNPQTKNSTGDSSNSYSQSNSDYLSKNLAAENGTDDNNSTTENSGTSGFSTPLSPTTILVNSTFPQGDEESMLQEETILEVIKESKDYNSKNETLTLNNDTIIPISDLIKDNATVTRFLETLDYTNATLANATATTLADFMNGFNATSTQNATAVAAIQDWKHLNSTQLLELLHYNSSLIAIAPATHSISGAQLGRNFAQEDSDQIQDKSSKSGTSRLGLPTTASVTVALTTLVGLLFFAAF